MSHIREFQPWANRSRRYEVQYLLPNGHWIPDDTFHTYLAARFNVAGWNAIGYTARIIDTKGSNHEA